MKKSNLLIILIIVVAVVAVAYVIMTGEDELETSLLEGMNDTDVEIVKLLNGERENKASWGDKIEASIEVEASNQRYNITHVEIGDNLFGDDTLYTELEIDNPECSIVRLQFSKFICSYSPDSKKFHKKITYRFVLAEEPFTDPDTDKYETVITNHATVDVQTGNIPPESTRVAARLHVFSNR